MTTITIPARGPRKGERGTLDIQVDLTYGIQPGLFWGETKVNRQLRIRPGPYGSSLRMRHVGMLNGGIDEAGVEMGRSAGQLGYSAVCIRYLESNPAMKTATLTRRQREDFQRGLETHFWVG